MVSKLTNKAWSPENSFNSLKKELMKIDPVAFAENHLMLNGKPLRLMDNGWKFMGDIYRHIVSSAMQIDGKPVVIVKGRQVGGSEMAKALELYMVSSGMYGVGDISPVRVLHCFPQLEMMHSYSKDKLDVAISTSVPIPDYDDNKNPGKLKPYVEAQKNHMRDASDTLFYKQFKNGNVLWCDSIGNDGKRVLGRTFDVCFFDEIQLGTEVAIARSNKCMTHSNHGPINRGTQVYFGTPRQGGTFFHKLWEQSDQRRYYLGCEKCGNFFLLYTPESDKWETDIWLYENIVKCPSCKCEQDKVEAVTRGKWIATPNKEDAKLVGFHINQLYIPQFTKEVILNEKPENNPMASEITYTTEVLGEFHSGEGMPITFEEIYSACRDQDRAMRKSIPQGEKVSYIGLDWGKKVDIDDGINRGQSYSCCVVLTVDNHERFEIDFATKLKKIDFESKKEFVENMFRVYNPKMAFGDIGYADDLSLELKRIYGDKYITVRSAGSVSGKIKYNKEELEVVMEKDYYITKIFEMLRKGNIRFPWASYERIIWLVKQCCSMESKVVMRSGQPHVTYIKGKLQNDGLMALIYAYLAYEFDRTHGFKLSSHSSDKSKFPKPVLAYFPGNM